MSPVDGNPVATMPRQLPGPPEPDLVDPALYLNRELSWLEFNRRVLHEAIDSRTPLLERLKFLAVFASNLDEFFQVRVAGIREQVLAGAPNLAADRMPPTDQLEAIRRTVDALLAAQSTCLRDDLLPALAAHGIVLHERLASLAEAEQDRLAAYFQADIAPRLVPVDVEGALPLPPTASLSLALAVSLADPTETPRLVRVEVPRALPRWIPLAVPNSFVPLESLIGEHFGTLFPGHQVLDWHAFRITRNTALNLEGSGGPEDEAEDLLELVEEEVRNRRFGEVVRLEVQASMPPAMRTRLMEKLNEADAGEGLPLTDEDVFAVPGPLALGDLMEIAALELPALKDPPFVPAIPPRLTEGPDLFATMRAGPILLHHPYDSFAGSVEEFITRATEDPDVVAIKMTLYRTGGEVAGLLAQAAERGKQVSVLIELQARFDEENNIAWAKRFEDIGVQVSYGVNGMKTHAKVVLVERMEGPVLRRYVHIGTGNYNPDTARYYTDFGLLSADPDLGADLSDLFDVLPAAAAPASYRKLIVAPRWMKRTILERIQRETGHAHRGEPARIIAKLNALVDAEVIAALYEASRAGVEVDLIVRGICCLRPGVPGVSDRIRVISIVGRFLEHSRAFLFQNAGEPEGFISSADWMPRNLLRRVEAAVPIEEPGHRLALQQWMETMLQDNRQAWDLSSDGRYLQRTPGPGEPERGSHRVLAQARR